MAPLFYRKGVSLVLRLRDLIAGSGTPALLSDVIDEMRRILGTLPALSEFSTFLSRGYQLWLSVLSDGIDVLDFGSAKDDFQDLSFESVGSACFLLYSFVTDVLTICSPRIAVVRPGTPAAIGSFAYVGSPEGCSQYVTTGTDHTSPALPVSIFVFSLSRFSVSAALRGDFDLPRGLLSASGSGLATVSLDSLSLAPASDTRGVRAFLSGSSIHTTGADVVECVVIASHPLSPVAVSPPLTYYLQGFVGFSLARLYSSNGVTLPDSQTPAPLVTLPRMPSPSLLYSELAIRMSDASPLPDDGDSEAEIVSLLSAVRRVFD